MVSTVNPAVVTTFWNIANHGPSTAVDVVLLVALPVGTSLTSAYVQAGIPACTFDGASRQVACAIGRRNGIRAARCVSIHEAAPNGGVRPRPGRERPVMARIAKGMYCQVRDHDERFTT